MALYKKAEGKNVLYGPVKPIYEGYTGEGYHHYARMDTLSYGSKAKCPFCFGTVPFLLQHPALLES